MASLLRLATLHHPPLLHLWSLGDASVCQGRVPVQSPRVCECVECVCQSIGKRNRRLPELEAVGATQPRA